MLLIADEMEVRSLSFDTALQDLATVLHRLALAQIAPQAIDEALPERERLFDLAKCFTPEDIQLLYQIVLHGRNDLNLAPDEYAGFTMTLMRMLAFIPDQLSSDEIAKKPGKEGKITQASHQTKNQAIHINEPIQERKVETADTPNQAWLAVIDQLKLNGMAKMLAQHCEAKLFSDNKIELCVPEPHKYLLEKAYQDKLKTALENYFGKPIQVTFAIGSVTGLTSMVMQDREKQAKQSEAIAAIEADPFVRELIENFDAKLIVASIKPIE